MQVVGPNAKPALRHPYVYGPQQCLMQNQYNITFMHKTWGEGSQPQRKRLVGRRMWPRPDKIDIFGKGSESAVHA